MTSATVTTGGGRLDLYARAAGGVIFKQTIPRADGDREKEGEGGKEGHGGEVGR